MSLVCGAAPIEVMIMCVPHVQPWAPEIDYLPTLLSVQPMSGMSGSWARFQQRMTAEGDREARRREKEMEMENTLIKLGAEMPAPADQIVQSGLVLQYASPSAEVDAKRKMEKPGPLGLLPCVVSLACL